MLTRAASFQAVCSPFQLALARPAIEHGLRGALGVWVPIGLGLVLGDLGWGVLAGFAAVNVLSADAGGAYQSGQQNAEQKRESDPRNLHGKGRRNSKRAPLEETAKTSHHHLYCSGP